MNENRLIVKGMTVNGKMLHPSAHKGTGTGTRINGTHVVVKKGAYKLHQKISSCNGIVCHSLTKARKIRTSEDIIVRGIDGIVISI